MLQLQRLSCKLPLPTTIIFSNSHHSDLPAAASAIRLHSALCTGQCARMHAGPQKNIFKHPAHFLSPAPSQPGLAQWVRASRYAVYSAGAPSSLEMSAAVPPVGAGA
jgi:hypothetical protein